MNDENFYPVGSDDWVTYQRHLRNRQKPTYDELLAGWTAMTNEARSMQRAHLGNHQGDIYHAMQYLSVKFGIKETAPMFQSIKD